MQNDLKKKIKLKIAPFLAPINSQTAAFWCWGLDYDDNQKATKDSLTSYGRLALRRATKILQRFAIFYKLNSAKLCLSDPQAMPYAIPQTHSSFYPYRFGEAKIA